MHHRWDFFFSQKGKKIPKLILHVANPDSTDGIVSDVSLFGELSP